SGRVLRPDMGVLFDRQNSPRIARLMGVNGVLVGRVLPNSPAAAAGMRSAVATRNGYDGDIVVGIDGPPPRDVEEFYRTLDRYKAGDRVTVKIVRQGQEMDVPVTLRER